jgi:hypothetical protein
VFLHDYFSTPKTSWPGVKRAVTDFENSLKISIKKIPIIDNCSMVLLKQ